MPPSDVGNNAPMRSLGGFRRGCVFRGLFVYFLSVKFRNLAGPDQPNTGSA